MATDRKVEVEAKYRIATPGAGDRYLVAPELGPFAAQGPMRQVRMEDRYVDSADWALTKAGFAARLRKTPRGTEIGLKSRNAVSSGSVHRREEIEGPADDGLIPSAWPASSARDVVMELCGDQDLLEVVTIRQLRRFRQLQAGDSGAELSVDEVEVVWNGNVIGAFEELELEIKSGDEASLPAAVAVLDHDPALQRQSRSKLDRALKAIRASIAAMPDEEKRHWENAPGDILGRRSGKGRGARSSAAGEGDPAGTAEPGRPG